MILWSTLPLLLFATAPKKDGSLTGPPLSPTIDSKNVVVRYMFDGGVLAHGRIVLIDSTNNDVVTATKLLQCLHADGVDFSKFYASVYDTDHSTGGWLPIHRDITKIDEKSLDDINQQEVIEFPLDQGASGASRRIDVKLFHRPADDMPERSFAEMMATAESQNTGKLPPSLGYFGIGVMGAKTQGNVGTLWRSSYQLGASFLFTIGQRYRAQSTDTVKATKRIPLFELDDWTAFAKFAPRGALWVAVEMGGTPLEEFEHPKDAIYILGSEDNGVPNSVVRACHDVVSLDSDRYASYNVAVAASIVMYDRMSKLKAKNNERESNNQ